MSLERELVLYQRERPAWIAEGRVGQWVVIQGDTVVGFYPSFAHALEWASAALGIDASFLVKEIVERDRPVRVSRPAVRVPNWRK